MGDPVGGPDAATQEQVDQMAAEALATLMLTQIMSMQAENDKMLQEE